MNRSLNFLWLSLALFVVLCLAFLLPIEPHDYWLYLRIGQDTLHLGTVPRYDTLTFSRAGQPVFYQAWLAALIFWLTYAAGGLTLTFLLRALLLALTYACLWQWMRHQGAGPRLSSLLLLLAALAGSNNWSLRPQIFAYPLFTATLGVLWNWQRGKNRTLWLLPLLSALWVNLHGSFVLLFLLAGLAWLLGEGNRTSLFRWTGLALLATLLNPRGIEVFGYVTAMLRSPADQLFSAEWRPPLNEGWQMNLFFAWLLLFIPLVAFSPRRFSRLEWGWFLALGWLALSGLRYVIWFLNLLAVLTAALLQDFGLRWLDRPPEKIRPPLNFVTGSLLLLLPLSLLPGLRSAWWPAAPAPYSLPNTPVTATRWLAEHPNLPGPLWSGYVFGSYLSFALPSRPVWIDTRFYLYPPSQWQRYQAIARAEYNWETLLAEEKVNLLMISVVNEPRLLEAVSLSPHWCLQYRDAYAAIYLRCVVGGAP
ncbi:MAG: hypothetical protein ACP5QU_03365 [Anaerolineae bacterium]